MQEQKPQDYLRELLFMLFARRLLIFSVTLIVFLFSLAVYLLSPPLYQANSSLLVRGKVVAGAVESLSSEGNKVIPVRKEDLYSEVELLSSTELMRRVAARLSEDAGESQRSADEMVESLRAALKYEVLPATNVIKISVTGQRPDELVRMVDVTLDEYVLYRLAMYQPAKSLSFFERQANRLRQEINSLESGLVELIASENTPEPLREIEANLLIKRDLEMELNKVSAGLIEIRSVRTDPEGPPAPDGIGAALKIENPGWETLQARRVELQLQRAELLRTYQRGSEKVRELGREMAENERLIAQAMFEYRRAIDAEIATLEEKERVIRERLAQISERNLVLQEASVHAERIRQELSLKQAAYEQFVQRREEARMTETLDHNELSSHVTVMERAWSSPDPFFPQPAMLPLGLITGLLLGMMIALMREFLDHSFKKPSDLERISQMPVIGSVPKLPTLTPGMEGG